MKKLKVCWEHTKDFEMKLVLLYWDLQDEYEKRIRLTSHYFDKSGREVETSDKKRLNEVSVMLDYLAPLLEPIGSRNDYIKV